MTRLLFLLRPTVVGLAGAALAACAVDRSGTFEADRFSADPNILCAGETTTLSWELGNIDSSPRFCSEPDGGYETRIACSASADCPEGGRCVDGLCLAPGVDPREVNFGSGCTENSSVTVFAAPPRPVSRPVEGDTRPVGSAPMTVERSVTLTMVNGRTPPASRLAVSAEVEVVPEDPATIRTVVFPTPRCNGSALATALDLETLQPVPILGSEKAQIVRVVNRSGYEVSVSADSPMRGPVTIPAGRETLDLNGPARGVWSLAGIAGSRSPRPSECLVAGESEIFPPVLDLFIACTEPD